MGQVRVGIHRLELFLSDFSGQMGKGTVCWGLPGSKMGSLVAWGQQKWEG